MAAQVKRAANACATLSTSLLIEVFPTELMASDQLTPTAPTAPTGKDATRSGGLKHFLLNTRRGQLLLALCTLRFLGALELIPSFLSALSTVGLWAYALAFVIWGLFGLRRSLLWRIRRKLIISYLLIGPRPHDPDPLVLCAQWLFHARTGQLLHAQQLHQRRGDARGQCRKPDDLRAARRRKGKLPSVR